MEVDLVVGAVVVVVVVLAGFPTKFRKPFILPSIASRRRVSDGDTSPDRLSCEFSLMPEAGKPRQKTATVLRTVIIELSLWIHSQ